MPLRRPATVVAALLAVVLVTGACGGGGDDRSAQTLSIVWGEPENPLIPGNTTEQNGGDVIDALFSGLVGYDVDTGAPTPEMAEAIDHHRQPGVHHPGQARVDLPRRHPGDRAELRRLLELDGLSPNGAQPSPSWSRSRATTRSPPSSRPHRR